MKCLVIFLFGLILTSANELALQEFTTANNLFAASVYKEIIKNHEGNFIVSPFSAETVLALAQFGCKGETAQEIRSSLHLPNDNEKIGFALNTLLTNLTNEYTLHTANKMYVKENFPIKKEFKKIASEIYQADIENIDFIQNTEAANKMNEWIEKQTEHKIKNLINSNDLSNRTKTVLINSLYFKRNWSTPFKRSQTYKRKFYKSYKDFVLVDTMHKQDLYKYYECSKVNAKFLEIPFEGEGISMTLILPNDTNDKRSFNSIENEIDKLFIPYNLTWHVVDVYLSKFKIESEFDFKAILENLGVSKVFDKNEADLSKIAGKKGDLFINTIAQRSFIDINEEGAEAAATFVEVPVPESFDFYSKKFMANHSFIFYIKVKDLIIFVGRVLVPNW